MITSLKRELIQQLRILFLTLISGLFTACAIQFQITFQPSSSGAMHTEIAFTPTGKNILADFGNPK
jgi:hypothetical protein